MCVPRQNLKSTCWLHLSFSSSLSYGRLAPPSRTINTMDDYEPALGDLVTEPAAVRGSSRDSSWQLALGWRVYSYPLATWPSVSLTGVFIVTRVSRKREVELFLTILILLFLKTNI